MANVAQDVGRSGPLALDDLIALNDEMAALARAGLPLERGLLEAGRDLPGKLGAITAVLGDRMRRGESLPQALAAEGDRFPPIYRAVVEAGLRSGRLAAALEALAGFARSYAEARRAIGLALGYPLLVLALAYGLGLVFLIELVPRFQATSELFHLPVRGALAGLAALRGTVWYWGPIVPVALVLVGVGWVRSGRAVGLQPGRARSMLRWFPWMQSMLARFEAANFAELLALLVEHRVPYPEAIALAGEATGDPALVRDARDLAAAVELGTPPAAALSGSGAFPPLLRWLLATGREQEGLVDALRHAAGLYRTRARYRAELIRVLLPTLILLVVGATAALLYASMLFVPLSALLQQISAP
jgi:general secretion pathway protein F